MLIIEPLRGERVDRMVRRYKRKCDKTKLSKRIRKFQYFTKSSDLRRQQIEKAILTESYKRNL